MSEQELAMLQSLLPALGVLIGGLVTKGVDVFQSWIDRSNKREILLRTKYEEMALSFLASHTWPHALLSATTLEQIAELSFSEAANKANMLCTVYFHKLLPESVAYIAAVNAFYSVTVSSFIPDGKRPVATHILGNKDYDAAQKALFSAKNELHAAIHRHAKTYATA